MSSYHPRSVKIGDALLREREARAQSCDELIMDIFFARNEMISASELEGILARGGHSYQITSIRRSLSNLEAADRLVKCKAQRETERGGTEHYYRLFQHGKDRPFKERRPDRQQPAPAASPADAIPPGRTAPSGSFDDYLKRRVSPGITLEDEIKELRREIHMREHKYPEWAKGRPDRWEDFARQLEVMRRTLRRLEEMVPKQANLFG